MRKIAILFAAFLMTMGLFSCQKCSKEADTKDALVVTTDDFEEIIKSIIPYVNKNYPEFAFYEAYGIIKQDSAGDFSVDRNTFHAAFGCPTDIKSLFVTVENDTAKFQVFNEPWLEDIYMTPFIPLSMNEAVKTIQKKIDIAPEGLPIVLRHQLYPGEAEPRWFIGTISDCHTVNVYTMEIDAPLKDFDGLMLPREEKK